MLPSVLIYEAPTRSRDLRSASPSPSVPATDLAWQSQRDSGRDSSPAKPQKQRCGDSCPVLGAVFIEAAHNRKEWYGVWGRGRGIGQDRRQGQGQGRVSEAQRRLAADDKLK